MSWLCKTLELATIPCAMPQLAWTTKVHQDSILRLRPLISSSLDLERQRHQCRDGYLLLREAGVTGEERDHPESTRCWDLALRLRRLLRQTEP